MRWITKLFQFLDFFTGTPVAEGTAYIGVQPSDAVISEGEGEVTSDFEGVASSPFKSQAPKEKKKRKGKKKKVVKRLKPKTPRPVGRYIPPQEKKSGDRGVVKVLQSRDTRPSLDFEEFYKMLPLDRFVPDGFDKKCVKAIILRFLNPRGKERYIEGNYTSFEYVRGGVLGKGFSPEEFKNCFEWLEKIGIIFAPPKHKRGKKLCSLRVKAKNVLSREGRGIDRVALKAAHELNKRTR